MGRRTRRATTGLLRGTPATVLALLLTGGLLLWPVLGELAADDSEDQPELVRITDYRADFVLHRDGRLDATETVTATFPPFRHGIFRFWDVTDLSDSRARLLPRDIAVTRDGEDEPFDLSWQGSRYRVARIGDADVELPLGSHVYSIRYSVHGALGPRSTPSDSGGSWVADGSDGSSFVWALVPGGWAMPIERARLSVRLPDEPERVACQVGDGSDQRCRAVKDGRTVSISVKDLPPRTAVSLRADLPLDAADRLTVPWSVTWDGVLGRSVPWLGLLLLLAALAFVLGRVWVGRASEEDPGQPVMYAPPDGLGPVQAHFVAHERIPGDALVATLLHQAEQGLVRLESLDDDHWRLTGVATAQQWAEADPVSHMVATRLGLDTPGATFEADGSVESGQTLQSVQKDLASITKQWAVNDGYLVDVASERRHQVLVVVAAVLGVILAIARPWGLSMVAAPALGLVVGGAPLLRGGVGTRRTPRGREVWARSAGFRRLLSTPSSEVRFDFSARKDLYTAYIPYAVAFGCADAWADKYRRTMHEDPPQPAWYPVASSSGGWFGGDSGGLASFESSLQSSIGAYEATQSSSSSGGGGGFSGGGGGGGGSW